ncbi:MAG: nuclear transport factor 2 family protein [Steroidobacteraceae bacterium]
MHELRRRSFIGRTGAFLALVPIAFTSTAALARAAKRRQVPVSHDERVLAMEREMELMAARLASLEDTEAIRRLQHAYGYYLDKCLYAEILDLFADDGEIHIDGGIYRGKASQKRFYAGRLEQDVAGGAQGPANGLLLDHLTLQDVIDVAADRRTAKARFRVFVQGGSHDARKSASAAGPQQWWEGGIYENTYVKAEDERWRFARLSYRTVYQAPYEVGWAHTRVEQEHGARKVYPDDPLGPDEVLPVPPPAWPEAPVVPFHYPNPVTGKPWV